MMGKFPVASEDMNTRGALIEDLWRASRLISKLMMRVISWSMVWKAILFSQGQVCFLIHFVAPNKNWNKIENVLS